MAEPPLRGQHAVVTGGGRGIGLATARRLAADGARISLLGRDRAALRAAAELLGGAFVHWEACDVADEGAVGAAFAAIGARARVTALVNNAGAARAAKFDDTDRALWDDMLAVNLTGAYLCTRAVLPQLRAAAAGRIVNVASTAGLIGYGYVAAYCAAKHGVIGLTRALAAELASTTITVNAVCPGFTDTDLVAAAVDNIVAKTGTTRDSARAALAAHSPQRRLVAPHEVAAAVAWLCRPDSGAINGHAIAIDGGEVTTA